MRVVAGRLRGKTIIGPPEKIAHIRPTSDRAKEALFSILKAYPQRSFLDLCSGTGSIALEAYSRGYEKVIAIDHDSESLQIIQSNCSAYPIRIIDSEVSLIAKLDLGQFDCIFCDPPYAQAQNIWMSLCPYIPDLLEEQGIFILETDGSFQLEHTAGLTLVKEKKYGRNHFYIFEKKG